MPDCQSYVVGKQGETATNKDNNISRMMVLNYCNMSPNMACFCKLMAQKFSHARACSDFSCGQFH